MNGEQLGQLHDRCLGQRAVNAVALFDENRMLVRQLRSDGSDDEVLYAVVEILRRYHQRRTSLGGAQIGEREGDENDVAALSITRIPMCASTGCGSSSFPPGGSAGTSGLARRPGFTCTSRQCNGR